MPPPKPSTETTPRPRVRREVQQIVRALNALGPTSRDDLERAVGGPYWDQNRFEKALTVAVARGKITVDADGRYAKA